MKDPTGKEWKLVSDASIIGEQWTGTEYLENDIKDFRVELVTPKLTYPELPKLQECMRRLKQIGAKVNDSCGIHVHVDAANHNRQSLKNLLSIMFSTISIPATSPIPRRSSGTNAIVMPRSIISFGLLPTMFSLRDALSSWYKMAPPATG